MTTSIMKHVLISTTIGFVFVTGASIGIFVATLGMCAICTIGLYLAGG